MATTKVIAQNIYQVYPYEGRLAWATLTTANTAKDGTGTVATVFTADTDGSTVSYLQCMPLGTNVKTLLRVFVNNGSTNATAANNTLFTNVTLDATTNSEDTAQTPIIVPIGLMLLNGYKINVCVATTVAAGWQVTAVGGDY